MVGTAGRPRQAVMPDVGETFSFYTSLKPEHAEKRMVPEDSEFNLGRVFVKIPTNKLQNPQAVLDALDLESQAKTFVEVTLGKTRGWVNITQIRLFGFPEAG